MAGTSYDLVTPASEAGERDRLIQAHLPSVRWIAIRIHEKIGGAVALEDLISAGVVGLIQAVDTYRPELNVSLQTFVQYQIGSAILESIRGLDGISARNGTSLGKIQDAIASAERRLQRAPDETEIAAELGASLAEYQQNLVELGSASLGNLLESQGTNAPASELERVLAQGINKLPREERLILTLYYKEGQNLQEIGEILGVHARRVCQLKTQAVLRLRSYIAHQRPAERGKFS